MIHNLVENYSSDSYKKYCAPVSDKSSWMWIISVCGWIVRWKRCNLKMRAWPTTGLRWTNFCRRKWLMLRSSDKYMQILTLWVFVKCRVVAALFKMKLDLVLLRVIDHWTPFSVRLKEHPISRQPFFFLRQSMKFHFLT